MIKDSYPQTDGRQFNTVSSAGVLRFALHEGQARAWKSDRRFTFIIAGTQSGKTSFLPLWLDREIERMGHGDYLAVTATYDLFKMKFLPEMKRYFVDLMGWQESKSERVFWREYKPHLFDRIILRSANSEGGLESATVKGCVLDECGQDAFRLTAWDAVQRRLSLSSGRVLGATTPYNLGWLKREIYDRWRMKDPEIAVIQFSSMMNPIFPPAEYAARKAKLPDWKFRMFYQGEFTKPDSLIYGDFIDEYRERGGHKVHPFDIPSEWPRYGGIDFGAVHTARIMIAKDPRSNIFFAYKESLSGGKTTKQHAAEAIQDADGVNMIAWAGGSKSETQQRADWSDNGIYMESPEISDVESGIDRVIELIKDHRLFIFDSLSGLLDEIGTYSRKTDENGDPGDEIKDKNTFHLLDSLRYVVAILETGGVFLFGT